MERGGRGGGRVHALASLVRGGPDILIRACKTHFANVGKKLVSREN